MFGFKTWLLEYEQINIRGEYWIDESGSVWFADGDVGDETHSSYVVKVVQHQVLHKLGQYNDSEYLDWNEIENDLIREKRQEIGPEEHGEDKDEDEILDMIYEEAGVTEEERSICHGRGDVRIYAIKNWGWKAMRSHHVETWAFTPHDMQVIARGIEEVLNQEGHYEASPDDEELQFYIYVYISKKNFNITLKELKQGRILAKQSQSTDIETAAKSLSNASKPVYLPKNSGLKGSEKTIAGIPASEYRRKYKNNYGENIKH